MFLYQSQLLSSDEDRNSNDTSYVLSTDYEDDHSSKSSVDEPAFSLLFKNSQNINSALQNDVYFEVFFFYSLNLTQRGYPNNPLCEFHLRKLD